MICRLAQLLFFALIPLSAAAQINLSVAADPAPVSKTLASAFELAETEPNNIEAARQFLSGELAGFDLARFSKLPKPDQIRMLKDGKAVARLPASSSNPDIYLTLSQGPDARWRITAFRALALPKLMYDLRADLSSSKKLNEKMAAAKRNLDLVFLSDQELSRWFATNRSDLETMRQLAPRFGWHDEMGRFRTDQPSSDAIVDKLALNFAEQQGPIFKASIGGLLDNEVGFLHASDADVPPISDADHIWIEPLGDGWYLFRTT